MAAAVMDAGALVLAVSAAICCVSRGDKETKQKQKTENISYP